MSINLRKKYVPESVSDVQDLSTQKIKASSSKQNTSKFSSGYQTSRNNNNNKHGSINTKWTTKKRIFVGCIVGIICLTLIISIILAVLLTRAKTAIASGKTVTYIAWTFDNVTTDTYGVYNGQFVNGATYLSPSSTQPYLGQGRALSVSSSSSQSFEIASPFLNLATTSFTIEAWIYPSTITGNHGILGQCQCISCSNQCFFFLIRSSRLHAGFTTTNNITGSTILTVNRWYHVAFVYNADTKQQMLYLNGVQERIQNGIDAYQGTNGTLTIGSVVYIGGVAYFNGYIDNVKIQTSAKSNTDILLTASLIAYYPFNLFDPTQDSGPNGLNGTSNNVASVSGRVNEALRFTGSSSYFQAYGFYQAGFGVYANQAYSVSLWIYPVSYSACTIVQMSTASTSSSCFNMLGIWSYTGNAAQWIGQGYAWPAVFGSQITLNAWTHISWTFSLTSGYRLYINGVLYGFTGYYSYSGTSGMINWIQIGYAFSCSSNYIGNAAFQGSIDEVYVHNRELTATEINSLANP